MFEEVHQREGIGQITMAEHQVLVELDPALTVEVDVKQLVAVKRLADPVHEVQPGHLLVTSLGIDPDHVGMSEGLDEGQRMSHRGQQNVASGFVGLGFDGEADSDTLIDHVLAQQINRFSIPFERCSHVLGRVVFASFTTTPHDKGVRSEFCGQVDVAQHLAEGEPTHCTVVAGEPAVLEDRLGEQVGRHHRHDQTRRVQCRGQSVDHPAPLGIRTSESKEVVVVQCDTVCTEIREPFHGLGHIQRRPRRDAERIIALPTDRPQTEGELVGPAWDEGVRRGAGFQDGHRGCSSEIMSCRCGQHCPDHLVLFSVRT